MKRFISLSLLSVLMMVSMPQKSHALVGLLIKKKTVTIVGGATTGAGVISMGVAKYVAAHSTAFLAGLGWGLVGVGLGALGIVILDEEEVEFKFPIMTNEKAAYLGVTSDEMAIYNSELNKLNRVKEVIEESITTETTIEESRDVWTNNCTRFLLEETCAVKALVADEIIGNFQVVK